MFHQFVSYFSIKCYDAMKVKFYFRHVMRLRWKSVFEVLMCVAL